MVIEGVRRLKYWELCHYVQSLLKRIANLETILNKCNGVVFMFISRKGKEQLYFARKTVSALAIYFLAKQTTCRILIGLFLLPHV